MRRVAGLAIRERLVHERSRNTNEEFFGFLCMYARDKMLQEKYFTSLEYDDDDAVVDVHDW